jgi:hypothetical protein
MTSQPKQLFYDERFYPTRRAVLWYSSALFLLSTAYPTNESSGDCEVLSKNGELITNAKLSFADVCFNTQLLTSLLIIAVIFYLIAFFRSQRTTTILNNSALEITNENFSGAFKRAIQTITNVTDKLGNISSYYDENLRFMNEYPINFTTDKIYRELEHDVFDFSLRFITKNVKDDLKYALRERDIKTNLSTDSLEFSRQLASKIQSQIEENNRQMIRDGIGPVERIKSLIDGMDAAKDKLHKIEIDFYRLSKTYSGETTNWYLWYDIFPTYLISLISLGLSALSFLGIRFEMKIDHMGYLILFSGLVWASFNLIWLKYSHRDDLPTHPND